MAKRERNKRAARKARQQERERVAVAQAAASAGEKNTKKSLLKRSESKSAKAVKPVAKADRKGMQVITGYFSDMRAELHKVTWPSKDEMRSYSVAVILTLLVFGVVVWLVDTGFVAVIAQYTSLKG